MVIQFEISPSDSLLIIKFYYINVAVPKHLTGVADTILFRRILVLQHNFL